MTDITADVVVCMPGQLFTMIKCGDRVDANNSFSHFMPDFISGASGADLEWYAGAISVTKGTILNNATGPAKYGYVITSSVINTPVGKVTPRFICKIHGFQA